MGVPSDRLAGRGITELMTRLLVLGTVRTELPGARCAGRRIGCTGGALQNNPRSSGPCAPGPVVV
jgi:hypothetical protein